MVDILDALMPIVRHDRDSADEQEIEDALNMYEPESDTNDMSTPPPDFNPYIRNPTGRNQHPNCPPPDDDAVAKHLRNYQQRNITNRKVIRDLLFAEHQIRMSEATVARRRKALGLKGSGATTQELPMTTKRQLVLDQMVKDPVRRQGPETIREGISHETGVKLTRDFVTAEMRLHDPDGFELREPTSKKIHRVPLVAIGPHHEWSADGHDKLSAIGFPIWGVRDKWSGKWLGLWVVPNNRLKLSVAYLFLSLVLELGGMPIQTTTDCGSETGLIYALVNALREIFSEHLPVDELPAHRFLKSVYNITIERGWLRLRIQWGDNVKVFWEAGVGIYNSSDPCQYELVQWLWSMLIQQELDTLKSRFNDHTVRYDKNKVLPSGVSPNVAFALHDKYGGEDCLQAVDRDVVCRLMEDIGGEDLVRFVSVEYAARAQEVFNSLEFDQLSFENVWTVFTQMLPLM